VAARSLAWLTCQQHGVLQLISTYSNERENDGADKL